eukprot:Hpha_TRINITY_DN16001_c3_g3::TRINITY_DN16001_c3_g3_i1::g.121405::m.121405
MEPRRAPRKWITGRFLGRGSYGCVNIAFDAERPDSFPLAVKQFGVESASEQSLKTIWDEVKLMRAIPPHERVVQCLGAAFDVSNSKLCIFMEYVSGGTLGDFLRARPPVPEPVAAAIMKQVTDGVWHLHRNRIYHRDLKGDNILVDSYRDTEEDSGGDELTVIVKLADFGAGKQKELATLSSFTEGARTQAGTAVGTSLWMAPEVISSSSMGQGYAPAKADVWSLGVVACETLRAGQVPWPKFDNQFQALFHIGQWRGGKGGKELPPKSPTGISKPCLAFLHATLTADAKKRKTAADLLELPWLKDARVGEIQGVNRKEEKAGAGASICVGLEVETHHQLLKLWHEMPKSGGGPSGGMASSGVCDTLDSMFATEVLSAPPTVGPDDVAAAVTNADVEPHDNNDSPISDLLQALGEEEEGEEMEEMEEDEEEDEEEEELEEAEEEVESSGSEAVQYRRRLEQEEGEAGAGAHHQDFMSETITSNTVGQEHVVCPPVVDLPEGEGGECGEDLRQLTMGGEDEDGEEADFLRQCAELEEIERQAEGTAGGGESPTEEGDEEESSFLASIEATEREGLVEQPTEGLPEGVSPLAFNQSPQLRRRRRLAKRKRLTASAGVPPSFNSGAIHDPASGAIHDPAFKSTRTTRRKKRPAVVIEAQKPAGVWDQDGSPRAGRGSPVHMKDPGGSPEILHLFAPASASRTPPAFTRGSPGATHRHASMGDTFGGNDPSACFGRAGTNPHSHKAFTPPPMPRQRGKSIPDHTNLSPGEPRVRCVQTPQQTRDASPSNYRVDMLRKAFDSGLPVTGRAATADSNPPPRKPSAAGFPAEARVSPPNRSLEGLWLGSGDQRLQGSPRFTPHCDGSAAGSSPRAFFLPDSGASSPAAGRGRTHPPPGGPTVAQRRSLFEQQRGSGYSDPPRRSAEDSSEDMLQSQPGPMRTIESGRM